MTIAMVIAVIALMIVGFYKGYLYKPVRDVSSEEPSLIISADKLVSDYKKDAAAADLKYLNKTIEVGGDVTSNVDSIITIDSVVVCGFDTLPRKRDNESVTVKGRCIGYDELFGEVKLDQCTIKE